MALPVLPRRRKPLKRQLLPPRFKKSAAVTRESATHRRRKIKKPKKRLQPMLLPRKRLRS
jgi:hypothetical protein